MTHSYYKHAMGIILCYDCTSEESFNNIWNWIWQIEMHAEPNIEKIIVGNKNDLETKVISEETGSNLSNEFGIKFFQASACTGENIEDAFHHISSKILQKLEEKEK